MTARASERPSIASGHPENEWIGLIAGNGRFPLLFAENARRLGYRVSAVALTGETDPSLEGAVDRLQWIALGQLGRLIKAYKKDGVRQAVMVGGVKKTHLFSGIRPDLRSLALLRRVTVPKDDMLLRAIAAELESEGIAIRESTFGLTGLLVEEGKLTRRAPTRKEWRDIEFGWEMAKTVGALDIGQCVVVKERVVVAVEAVEGTDQAIRRGGKLARGGAVDTDRMRAAEIGARYGCPAMTDFRTLLRRVDAVSIAVPTLQHHDVGRACLEAGVHVLLEKPMTATPQEAEDLLGIASARKLTLQIGHIERFNAAFRKALGSAGGIKDPVLIECRRWAPFTSRGADVDVVLDLMIHDLDLALALAGAPVRDVQAHGVAIVSAT